MIKALIINSFGRNFIVKVDNTQFLAITKTKKTNYVVGDLVNVTLLDNKHAQIVSLIPRNNLIARTDKNRSKIIASNVSQIIIVIAVKPNFNINLLNSCLVFAESQRINPIIIINKNDIPESNDFIESIEYLYKQQLKYKVFNLCATKDSNIIKTIAENNQSLLIGQSGVGKSTIINSLILNASAQTSDITKSETSGKHTTTNSTLYYLNHYSTIIDSPGLQEFGLYHLSSIDNICSSFPECADILGQCKFRNCRHLYEPGCKVIQSYQDNKIDKQRFEFLQSLIKKLL